MSTGGTIIGRDAAALARAKRGVFDLLQRVVREPALDAALFADALAWHGQHPVNDGLGVAAFREAALAPLARALPDVARRDDIVIAGHFRGHDWIAATGHYCGTFADDLFGIPATGHLAFLRYGEFYRLGPDGRVDRLVTLWDLIGLMGQAGVSPLPPAAGVEILVPGPATRDGVRPDTVDADSGAETTALVEAMIAGLMEYDGRSLDSMGQERFWAPEMLWYGPGGIGSNRRLKGFQDFHQRPFLTAFPDRKGGNHLARVGDGAYCASGGWPSINATHAGPYLDQPATGRRITMRVMDWWRAENGLLAENWVFIDLPHLFLNFGRDLFVEMRALSAKR
jgi:predicted ester cyclase